MIICLNECAAPETYTYQPPVSSNAQLNIAMAFRDNEHLRRQFLCCFRVLLLYIKVTKPIKDRKNFWSIAKQFAEVARMVIGRSNLRRAQSLGPHQVQA